MVAVLQMFGYGFESFYRDDRYLKQQSDINQFVAIFRRDFEQATDIALLDDKTLVLGFIKNKGTLSFTNSSYDHREDNIKIKIYQMANNSLRIRAVDPQVTGIVRNNGLININKTTLINAYVNSMNDTDTLIRPIDVSKSQFLIDSSINATNPWMAGEVSKLYIKIMPLNTNIGKFRNANVKNILSYEFSLYGKYKVPINP